MPLLAIKYGYNGVAMAVAVISLSSIAAIISAKKYVNFDLFASVLKPLFASTLMGFFMYFLKIPYSNLILVVIGKTLLGSVFYLFVSRLIIGRSMFVDMSKIYHEIKKNR